MSVNHSARRLALLAGVSMMAAAGTTAFAADTTTTIAVGVTQATAITASPTAPDTYTLNILGTLRNGGAGNLTNVSIQGTGSGALVINNDGRLQGRLNRPAATGPITLNNNTGAGQDALNKGWHTSGTSSFGSGADLITNAAEGVIATADSTTFAFGAGSDSFVNAGRLIVGRGAAVETLTLTGLETFANSGLILLGSKFSFAGDAGLESDLAADDRLIAGGVAFTGSGDSRIGMDVILSAVTQTGCPTTPTAADCVDFTGGSTAGSTLLLIRDAQGIVDNGAFNAGVTLIVGSSAAEHFSLDPASDYYQDTPEGPALQKRLVAYRLVYDDATDSHKLVSNLADEAFQPMVFAASAQETWRSTTGTWLTRQADLRATPGGLETSGGVWGRLSAGVGERDVGASYAQGATTYDYDLSHKQRDANLVFGADMLAAASGDSVLVVGAMVGFARSDLEFDAAPTEAVSTGFTGGLYASYVAGPLFVDGVVNLNLLHLRANMPNMGLGQDIALKQDIKSLGGQVEAGWRFEAGGGLFVEPLAGLSYVTTAFDDIDIPGGGGVFDFEDEYASFRIGGGLRAGADSALMGMRASYSLAARYWTESEGENVAAVTIANGGATTPMVDDFSGGFADIAASLGVYSEDGVTSGFLNLGGKFADDYRSVEASAGLRLRF